MSEIAGSNHLVSDFKCPKCGAAITCGIGFRAGTVKNLNYQIGDKIDWSGKRNWPEHRPPDGTFKTIGYFECENLRCETWNDCFPQVQEVLITIKNDIVSDVKEVFYQPEKIEFSVFSLDQEI
ncbi:MAG: hypothetical protein K2X81_20965 [Candidatus Obscuribacterales bacterium]|nr:hypothetical protein [Candidatus Obscuribacterales bacterium]